MKKNLVIERLRYNYLGLTSRKLLGREKRGKIRFFFSEIRAFNNGLQKLYITLVIHTIK